MASIPAGGNVDEGFRLALTGTPGTGKSTVASLLSEAGFEVLTVESLAEENGLKGELDPADNALVIDTDALHQALLEPWQTVPVGPVVVDGHLSHHLPCDAVVVVRGRDGGALRLGGERHYEVLVRIASRRSSGYHRRSYEALQIKPGKK